jgi:hypothetical protein
MRLGYFCYNTGLAQLARLALYRSEPNIDVIFEGLPFRSFSPMIAVGPSMLPGAFSLHAMRHGAIVGKCEGTFLEGTVLLTERTGVFAGIDAKELTERETAHAVKSRDCPAGLSSTSLVVLSRKWEGYMITLGEKGVEEWDVEYWDDEKGIYVDTWFGKRRVRGWSTRYSGSAGECNASLAALISGPYTARVGWLLRGDDAGLAIGGALGDTTGALWLPNLESFPGKCIDKIKLPPEEAIAPTNRVQQGAASH